MVGIEFDRTSIPKTSKHSLCHNSPCTNPSKTALSLENRQHPCLMNALPVSHPHYPSPRTKLASPRKRVRFCCSVKPSQLWWGLNLIELLSLKLQSIRSATIRPAPTFPKPHYPSPRTKLASLVKGRWLDGTTQTVALLRPTCDMSALFILQTFLPSRRRDCLSCTQPLHPHNHCKRTIIPLPCTITLAF